MHEPINENDSEDENGLGWIGLDWIVRKPIRKLHRAELCTGQCSGSYATV